MIVFGVIVATAATTIAIAAGIPYLFGSATVPHDLIVLESRLAPDQPTSRICEAHLANIDVATISGAGDLASMVHEALDLDVTAYPFDNLDALINSGSGERSRARDLRKVVLDAYMRETDSIQQSGANLDDVLGTQRLRALQLCAVVFLDTSANIEYLRKVRPAVDEAAKACKPKDGRDCTKTRKVAFMDQWCRAYKTNVGRVG